MYTSREENGNSPKEAEKDKKGRENGRKLSPFMHTQWQPDYFYGELRYGSFSHLSK